MSKLQNVIVGGVRSVIGRVPASWLPGATPDPLDTKRVALGTQQSRVDGPDKVRGAARFAAEVPMDGLLYAVFVDSTIAKGRIAGLDTIEAEAAPGVALVMTHRNAPRMAPPPPMALTNPKAAGNQTFPIMQDDQVRWNGQVVAVVLADSREQADHAATLVRVRYDAAPARTRFEEGKTDATTPDSLLIEPNRVTKGSATRQLDQAAHRIDATYRTPWENHNPVEPHAATIVWHDGKLTVHDSTQMLHGTRSSLAKVFGLKDDAVHVSSPFVGGGFGSKALWDHQILGVAAAKLAQRPVRVVLTRAAMHRLIGGRAQTEQQVALGADKDGKLTAIRF